MKGRHQCGNWMVVDTKATTWAVFQCQFRGLSPKPTRFVPNIPGSKSLKYAKWPSFTKLGQYIGPLPFKCGHKWHVKKLIGKSKDGKFQTAPSAAYPAGLCKFLAELISSVLRKGENELQSIDQGALTKAMVTETHCGALTTAMVTEAPESHEAQAEQQSLQGSQDMAQDDHEFPPKPLGLPSASDSNVGITGSGSCLKENLLVSPFGLNGLDVRWSLWTALGCVHLTYTDLSKEVLS